MQNFNKFKNSKVLITGGLGFIGSNLAIKLVKYGAQVTIVDAMIPEYGGNLFNIYPIRNKVHINFSNITDQNSMNYLVKDNDYIFHLAGQVDHILSLTDPFPDIEFNIKGTAVLMEACKNNNPKVKVIHTGTRGQYGPAVTLPVNEESPTHPLGIYEISRLTAEKIIKVYNDIHGIRSVLLRLTNVYGPRSQMIHSRYGVVNWFIRLALDNQTIKVFGNGDLKRDFLYIDDCIDAMLSSALSKKTDGEILNVGHDTPSNFLEITKLIINLSHKGKWEFAPFTPERKAQEPGDFYSDITKIKNLIDWSPRVSLEEGVKKTISFYEKHKKKYW